MISLLRALGWVGIAALAGCGGGSGDAFRTTFADNEPAALASVFARLRAAPPSGDAPVAVALTEDALVAWDLEAGRQLWSQPVAGARSAPHLAGRLVVLHEGDRVVARRLSDGREAFGVADEHFSVTGAGGDGDTAAIVLSTTGGVGAQSRVLIARGDGIAHRLDVESSVGAPDVRGGLVFVPWGSQNVSVLDASSGAEVARLRSHAGVVSHVRADERGVVFGQAGLGRLGASAGGDAESVGWYAPDSARLPGGPPPWRSAYDPPAAPNSAMHKIRLVWAAREGEGAMAFTDDALYLTFYRFVFALAPADLSVRWVHQHPSDVVGASATDGGVLIADAAGGLSFLGTDGRPRMQASMGARPLVVELRLGGYVPAGAPQGELVAVADQLLSAAQNTDSRLVPGRELAVRALAAQSDPAVTQRLIVLCDDGSLPGPLRAAACESLAARPSGGEALLAALRRHASFLEETTAPPVGPLARLASNLSERAAVPLLVAHLADPETSAPDVAHLAVALGALGDESAIEPLRDFLWLYHAEATDDPSARALAAVARALVTLSGPAGRETVREVVDAPYTPATALGLLVEVLAQTEPEQQPAESEAEAAAAEE